MSRAIVYDRCIDIARSTCARLWKGGITATAVHPTDFDRTFESGIPHVVITELEMPLLSGFELIRQVRGEFSADELPIVVFTKVDDLLGWDEARALGANELVCKTAPQPMTRLMDAVQRCIGESQWRPPAAVNPRHANLFQRWLSRGQLARAA